MGVEIGIAFQAFRSYPETGKPCSIKYILEQFLALWFGGGNFGYIVLREYFRNFLKILNLRGFQQN